MLGRHKYIVDRTLDLERLYDLQGDPSEQQSLGDDEAAMFDMMRARLNLIEESARSTRQALGLTSQGETYDLAPAEVEALRSLGYIN